MIEPRAGAAARYCQPGQLLTAAALLAAHPHPTEAIDPKAGVLCRCGTDSG